MRAALNYDKYSIKWVFSNKKATNNSSYLSKKINIYLSGILLELSVS